MQFKQNTEVLTSSGNKAGVVNRVVIDPKTEQVTHLVIEKGHLFTEDRLIPIDLIKSAGENQVTLKIGDADLNDLPHFEERHFLLLLNEGTRKSSEEQNAIPVYWYPPVENGWWTMPGNIGFPIPPFVFEAEENVPNGSVAVKEGARVESLDGQEIGRVESVLTAPDEHRVTHLLVSSGLLHKEHKLLPSTWIETVLGNKILLNVDAAFIRQIPKYEPVH
jgi:uncharacterized protein YrrD